MTSSAMPITIMSISQLLCLLSHSLGSVASCFISAHLCSSLVGSSWLSLLLNTSSSFCITLHLVYYGWISEESTIYSQEDSQKVQNKGQTEGASWGCPSDNISDRQCVLSISLNTDQMTYIIISFIDSYPGISQVLHAMYTLIRALPLQLQQLQVVLLGPPDSIRRELTPFLSSSDPQPSHQVSIVHFNFKIQYSANLIQGGL